MQRSTPIHLLFVLAVILTMVDPAFAGDKKFNICLASSETRTLLAYGGMEIEARCLFTAIPSLEHEPQLFFKSSLSHTQTTWGHQSAPFETLVFTDHGTHCGSGSQRAAMISETGHYLSMDGEGLIMCMNVGSCGCTLSGTIQKERIKRK